MALQIVGREPRKRVAKGERKKNSRRPVNFYGCGFVILGIVDAFHDPEELLS
jgi:hypothetical protein